MTTGGSASLGMSVLTGIAKGVESPFLLVCVRRDTVALGCGRGERSFYHEEDSFIVDCAGISDDRGVCRKSDNKYTEEYTRDFLYRRE